VRTKIIALAAGTFLVYRLPAQADLDAVRLVLDPSTTQVTLTDERSILMDLSEHVAPPRAA